MSLPPSRVFVDTAGWYALVDAGDQHHGRAKEWFEESKSVLITTDYVFDEIITLLRRKLGHDKAVAFGQKIKDSSRTRMQTVDRQDRESAWVLFQKYDDERFSFTDCTSVAVMTRLETKRVFTFDRDFVIAGFQPVPD